METKHCTLGNLSFQIFNLIIHLNYFVLGLLVVNVNSLVSTFIFILFFTCLMSSFNTSFANPIATCIKGGIYLDISFKGHRLVAIILPASLPLFETLFPSCLTRWCVRLVSYSCMLKNRTSLQSFSVWSLPVWFSDCKCSLETLVQAQGKDSL